MKGRGFTAGRQPSPAARTVTATAVALFLITGHAADIQQGEELFQENCAACHTILENVTDKSGPNLNGVFGRKAGTEDFSGGASDEMKASGVTWGVVTLQEFLQSPALMIRGTKMVFRGLPDAEARLALVCYLERVTGNNSDMPSEPCAEGR
jgi:cytochrome c